MRLNASKPWTLLSVGLLALTFACGGEKEEAEAAEAGTEAGTEAEAEAEAEVSEAEAEVGDGDGEPTTGDGDGEPTTGDGDGEPTGDGDGEPTGDGDGEPTGDGDGEPTGDGDGEPTGDGDGEPNPECVDLETADECAMNPSCQPVMGQPLKQNGPDSPCLEESEFLGCIGMQGCGDAITWFCQGNSMWQVPDTCGPDGADQCEPPADPVEACP